MSGGSGADSGHWFEEVAAHLGEAYLRYSFTYGTVQEVDFLVEALELDDGARILDVGCGVGQGGAGTFFTKVVNSVLPLLLSNFLRVHGSPAAGRRGRAHAWQSACAGHAMRDSAE